MACQNAWKSALHFSHSLFGVSLVVLAVNGSAMPETSAKPIAVIDIGTSAIRMTVAEVNPGGHLRILDELEHHVNLGKATFLKGVIPRQSIERCVEIMRGFQRVAEEYGADRELRAVATTAVRECDNQAEFIDRVFVATGIDVEVVDEGETTRLLYNSLTASFAHEPGMATTPLLVLDVGAGMTEVLLLRTLRVAANYTHRLGALRLRAMLERYDASVSDEHEVIANQVQIMVEQMQHIIPAQKTMRFAAIGGDMQFAAARLVPEWSPGALVEIPLADLENLSKQLLTMPVDQLVRSYGMSVPDAETVAPTLQVVCQVARSYGVTNVTAAKATLLSGVLQELAFDGEWSSVFIEQIKQSALDVGKKYEINNDHGGHVAALGDIIFDALQDRHGMGTRERVLMHVAGLIHETGLFVSNRGHHKHSYYLIDNSDIFGLSRKQIRLVALISRYHRRAMPKVSHEGYGSLDREARIMVSKLAAIHRVADALDRSLTQRIQNIECEVDEGNLWITVPGVNDFTVENIALKEKGNLMEHVYGLRPVLRSKA